MLSRLNLSSTTKVQKCIISLEVYYYVGWVTLAGSQPEIVILPTYTTNSPFTYQIHLLLRFMLVEFLNGWLNILTIVVFIILLQLDLNVELGVVGK